VTLFLQSDSHLDALSNILATMSDIPALLLASLNPETRKPAEQSLSALSAQQGFIPHLVQLFLDTTQDRAVRLSASVYLKNLVKLRWEEVSISRQYDTSL